MTTNQIIELLKRKKEITCDPNEIENLDKRIKFFESEKKVEKIIMKGREKMLKSPPIVFLGIDPKSN